MSRRASAIFNEHVRGKNVMTPDVIAHGFIGTQWVFEITQGTGFVGEPMFGVTVIDQETGALNKEMGGLVISKEAAYELVEILRESETK